MNKHRTKISYGQTFDEFIKIDGLADEMRFKICMKLYKLHDSIEELESAITPEALKKIEDIL